MVGSLGSGHGLDEALSLAIGPGRIGPEAANVLSVPVNVAT